MTTSEKPTIAMRCPSCGARLRAQRQLLGHICPCPRCRHRVTVRIALPEDSDVMIDMDSRPKASWGR